MNIFYLVCFWKLRVVVLVESFKWNLCVCVCVLFIWMSYSATLCIFSGADMQQYILFNCFYADYVDFHLHRRYSALKIMCKWTIHLNQTPNCTCPSVSITTNIFSSFTALHVLWTCVHVDALGWFGLQYSVFTISTCTKHSNKITLIHWKVTVHRVAQHATLFLEKVNLTNFWTWIDFRALFFTFIYLHFNFKHHFIFWIQTPKQKKNFSQIFIQNRSTLTRMSKYVFKYVSVQYSVFFRLFSLSFYQKRKLFYGYFHIFLQLVDFVHSGNIQMVLFSLYKCTNAT